MNGEVRLQVPATPEFFRMVRVITSAVANARGFALDGLEDLRIAVHELCGALIGAGRPGTVALRFLMTPEGLLVEGTGRFDEEQANSVGGEPVLSDLSRQILSVVVDSFELDGPGFRMTKHLDHHVAPDVVSRS